MSDMTFNQFRQSVKNDYYKKNIRSVIEHNVLNILYKYENSPMTYSNNDSLKNELDQLLKYYISAYRFDSNTVYDVYNEIAEEYNRQRYMQIESSFIDDSIQSCVDKYGYSL